MYVYFVFTVFITIQLILGFLQLFLRQSKVFINRNQQRLLGCSRSYKVSPIYFEKFSNCLFINTLFTEAYQKITHLNRVWSLMETRIRLELNSMSSGSSLILGRKFIFGHNYSLYLTLMFFSTIVDLTQIYKMFQKVLGTRQSSRNFKYQKKIFSISKQTFLDQKIHMWFVF